MADIEFTKDQQNAIDAKGGILVSAAAGSGKTAVLTERVIKKITDKENPVSADKLLIVTFTNAAAAEMRSRIEKRLFEKCTENPADTYLIRQKHLIGNADICTIDSFCINLVRENFEKCGVSPDFKVSDGSDLSAFADEIKTEIIDNCIKENSDAFQKLLEITSCEYDDFQLKELIEDIYLYSRQIPFPDRFLDGFVKPYKTEFNENHLWYIYSKGIIEEYSLALSYHLKFMADAVPYLERDLEKCNDDLQKFLIWYNEFCESLTDFNWDNVRKTVYSFLPESIRLSTKNGFGETYKSERKSVLSYIESLKTLLSDDVRRIDEFNAELLPSIELLIDLVKEYDSKLFAKFNEENTLAFYHTEQLALNVLCSLNENGEICENEDAKQYLSKYEEVMVDEFQDVNDLQNLLFDILSANTKKLFVVGDIKQSIYRFRGSNLNNFLSKKQSYVPFDTANESDNKKIILSDNFRSRKGICDFVNFTFSLLMNENTGSIVYNEEERLNFAAKYPESDEVCNELLVVDKGDADENTLYEYECLAIAKYIKDLIKDGFCVSADSKTKRKAGYGDICILLDKVANKAPVLVKVLSENGIPVSFSNGSFGDSAEVSLILSLLTVLENPAKDVELLTVMMSPLFSFTADEMAVMRANKREGDIYGTVVFAAENGDEKAKKFIKKLADLRNETVLLPLDKLIIKLIYDFGLLSVVSSMPNGKQRRANLLSLSHYASDFKYSSVGDFADYISSLSLSGAKKEISKPDFVTVMSMHKSKGLQFPICILSDLSSRINASDSYSRVVFEDSLGIGFKYYDESEELYTENLGKKIISKKIYGDNLQEKMRLLYVAETRAKEKLVLVTALKNSEKTLTRISEKLSKGKIDPYFIKSASTLGDMVLAVCLLHPDCSALRNLADIKTTLADTNSKISVKINDCAFESDDKEDEVQNVLPDLELSKQIAENISYVYPFEELSKIISKTSVSAVAEESGNEEFMFNERPSFMNAGGLSSSERGTAMHTVMEFIEFAENVDVNSEIERLTEWQYITQEQADSLDIEKLNSFFGTALYKRILNSSLVKREMRFLTELPANKIDGSVSEKFADTPVMVQGAVDLLFVEDDKLVIVDFKTDRNKDETALKSAYGEQLSIYSNACAKIMNIPVKEKIIYSFPLSKEIKLD